MYKPSPRWRGKDTIEERTPQPGARSWPDPDNPQKGATRSHQKGIHPEAATKPQRSRTTPRRGYLASIFGTLLSSQGSNAHRLKPSGSRSGLLLRTAVLVSPPYLTRVEGTGTGQASACPVRSVPCGGGRGPTLADPEGRLTAPIGVGNPRDRTRCCEVGHPRDRPPCGVRSSLAG
jgi:hypothetical protein